MFLENLTLTNFRNYQTLKLKFIPGTNIIIGRNGAGKTNILEALVVLSNTKSFRLNNDFSMVKKNEDFAKIETYFTGHNYKIVINEKNKYYYIDDKMTKNQNFIGNVNCVLFEPSDVNLFKESPKSRRRLLDLELSKIHREYLYNSFVYYKLLKEKNNLLKQTKIDKVLLDTIDESLVKPINIIVAYRNNFIKFISENITNYYQRLSGTNAVISLKYEACISKNDLETIKNKLIKYRDKDLIYHTSYLGIHKEDFKFYYNNQDVSEVASQGQRKMIMIAFKISLIDYIKKYTNDNPILLLDDILSELDENNQKRLINLLDCEIQTIITSTDVDKLNLNRNYRLIEIK